jgi:hypothetical protein
MAKIYRPSGPGLGQSLEQRSETQNLYEAINALSRRIADLEGKLAVQGRAARSAETPVRVVASAAGGATVSDDTPVAETVGVSGFAGGSDEAARADHVHPFPGSDVAVGLGDANAEGTAATIARSDHVHKRTTRVKKGGSDVGTRNAVNFVDGADVTHTVADNSGQDRVDVTGALTDTGVAADTYGDASHYPVLTVDAKGRVTAASEQVVTSDDHKVLNTSADTTAGYLNDKLIVSSPLTKTTDNAGANENLALAVSAASTSAAGVVQLETGSSDTSASHVVTANDTRLSDARTPTAHASTHASAGSDPVSLAASQITTGQLALARGGTGADLSATGGTGKVLKQTSAGAAVTVATLSGSEIPNAAGDVSGAYTALSVDKLKGTAVASTSPSDQQVLTYSSSNTRWEPANVTTVPSGTDGQTLRNNSGNWAASSALQNDGTDLKMTGAMRPTSTSAKGLVVKGLASQTGDLQEWQNSSGTVLSAVDKNGYVGVGSTAPTAPIFVDTNALGAGLTAGDPAIFVQDQNNNAKVRLRSYAGTTQPEFHGERGTISAGNPAAVGVGSSLCLFTAGGHDGTAWSGNQGSIALISSGAWSGSSHSTEIDIQLTPNGSTTMARVGRWFNSGNLSIGSGTGDPNVTLKTGGFGLATATKSADYTMTGQDGVLLVARNATPKTITLPSASQQQVLYIISTGTTGSVTVSRQGADTITSGGTTSNTAISLVTNGGVNIFVSDGSSIWYQK